MNDPTTASAASTDGTLSRRAFVQSFGAGGLFLAAPGLWLQADVAGTADPEQIHLQFGADASRQVTVSWDAKSGVEVFTHHAELTDLDPGTSYVYQVMHDCSGLQYGSFATAPSGRAALRCTSFGNQRRPSRATAWRRSGRPTTRRGSRRSNHSFTCSTATCATPTSARLGRTPGAISFSRTRCPRATGRGCPPPGTTKTMLATGQSDSAPIRRASRCPMFKAGAVRVLSLDNDDVSLQDGGDNYVRGYSQGAQKQWLERTLRDAHDDPDTDEHHFERTLAVRGVDTTEGTVHMIIGGGGTSAPSNQLLLDPPKCEVITDVGPQPPTPSGGARPHRASIKVTEDATWVGTRDKTRSYGFASFDVEPNPPGGKTQIRVKIWDTAPSPTGMPTVFEEVTLQRPRRDGESHRSGAAAELAGLA